MHFRFQVAFPMGQARLALRKHNSVTLLWQFCGFFLVHVLCVLLQSFRHTFGILSLGDFKGGNFPLAKLYPAKLSLGEIMRVWRAARGLLYFRCLGKRLPLKAREWVMWKKEQQRSKGKRTANDSKYTARKRKERF